MGEKYYIIYMIYKNSEEYHQELERFVKLRKDRSTPVAVLEELYQNLIDTEIDIEQDTVINLWLDDQISGKSFAQFFFVDCEERSIAFLEDRLIPCAEEIVEKSEQDGLQD